MTQSTTGSRAEAIRLQAENNVAALLRGPWFHVSKDNIELLTDKINHDDNDDEYTWFSRSPVGGGHSGGCVLLAYVVDTPANSRVFDAAHGDSLGKENGTFLKNWWLRVHKSEVNKLMVVSRFAENQANVQLTQFQQDPEYVALRQASISLTLSANQAH